MFERTEEVFDVLKDIEEEIFQDYDFEKAWSNVLQYLLDVFQWLTLNEDVLLLTKKIAKF